MMNKMVTMCSESYVIAQNMKNFSGFVRRATLASNEGGYELVDPALIPTSQCLAIVLSRNQKENGFDHALNDVLLSLMHTLKES
tara:strand:- start:453 stop:704 length:252 start_codon:yes stop_codon:yes gene_type:complete